MIRRTVLATALSLLSGAFSENLSAAVTYNTMTDLGSLPGKANSYFSAVSADGSIMVGASATTIDFDVDGHAAIYRLSTGQWTDIGTLGGSASTAYGISADGNLVVGDSEYVVGDANRRMFLYNTLTGAMTVLGVPLGGTTVSDGLAISGNGQVITGTYTSGIVNRAFSYSVGTGAAVDLGFIGTGPNSYGTALSYDGSVIVGFSNFSAGTGHAFRYTVATGMTDLGTPAGYESSVASGVSGDGTVIVGWAATTYHRAFRYTTATGMVDLGTLAGGPTSASDATAISADGRVIVGDSEFQLGNLTRHAFKYTIAGGMVDLGTLGGASSTASAVSTDGSIIVGYSEEVNGDIHAFIYRNSMVDIDYTYQAIALNAGRLNGLMNLQYTGLLDLLEADCAVYGSKGLCLSVTGRYDHSLDGTGVNDGVTGLRLGYRFNPHLRAGVAMDYTIAHSLPAQYQVASTDPSVGAFLSLEQREDGTGAGLRVSAAKSSEGLKITRDVIGMTEAGTGSSDLDGKGVEGELSWGWKVNGGWLLQPYAGIRYMKVDRKGYSETSGADFPVSYDDAVLETTTLLAGVRTAGKVSKHFGVHFGAGIEHDVHNRMDDTTGTISLLGPYSVSAPGRDKTRAVASIGGFYSIGSSQRLGIDLDYRGQQISTSSAMQVAMTYCIGF
jgi:probable HAF family extracellular repeat protein